MNTLRTFIYIIVLTLVSCKSTSKLTIFYGILEKLLIYNNKEMVKGDLNFLIGDYKFIMNFSDFKESLDAINKEHFYSPLDLKIPNKHLFSIIDNNDYLILNLTDTLKNNDGAKLYPFLDYLFKSGKMYFEKSGIPLAYLEYIHWNPQYQGTVYSKWNDNKKVIKKFTWAFVD